MTIKTKYNIGDKLFVKHDPEQKEYEVVAIRVLPGAVIYELNLLEIMLDMYDFQVSDEKDQVKLLGLKEKETDE